MTMIPPKPAPHCTSCGSAWLDGVFDKTCDECGGGAMQHACLVCSGTCGAMWSRAVLDSNDTHTAHWIGRCYHQHDRYDEPDNPPRTVTRYLFRFGYETPKQRVNNARNGWDDQDSSWVFVEAPSKREAAALGRAFADLYVLRLFGPSADLQALGNGAYVWSEEGYAQWLEEDLAEIKAAEGVAPVLSGPDALLRTILSLG